MDSTLDGFEVIEDASVATRRYKWDTGRILDAFLDSGEACIGKRYGGDVQNAYAAFRASAIRRHMPVTVHKSGDLVIIVRNEGDAV